MRVLATLAGVLLVIAGLVYVVLPGDPSARTEPAAASADRPRPQGDWYRSPVPEPRTLNPFTTTAAVVALYVLPFTHDSLVDRDPQTGAVRPAAAESWEVSADGLVIDFVLREDLRFADGSPVSAADIEFTLATAGDERLQPRSSMAVAISELASADFIAPRTIRLRLAEPRASSVLALGSVLRIAQRRFFVDAAAALDPAAADPCADAFFETLPMVTVCGPGTGPYAARADGWQRGVHLDLVRNPHCWRRAAQPEAWNLDGLQLRFVVDEAGKLAAARTGEVDWFVSQSGVDLADLQQRDEVLARDFVRYQYDPAHIGHYYIAWNCGRPPLDRAEVRRALSMAIDREAIRREAFGGLGTVAKGWFKPGSPDYPDHLPKPEPDSVAARALLAEQGFGPGGETLRIELLCATEIETLRKIGDLLQRAFEDIGVALTVQPIEFASMSARQQDDDFDALIWLQYHDAVIDPYDFFASQWNDMNYVDEELDALLLRARGTMDPDARGALYDRFHDLLQQRQPVTLLIHPTVQVLLHRRFRDVVPGPLGLFPERWWVAADERIVGR